jgi:hypothetical protein
MVYGVVGLGCRSWMGVCKAVNREHARLSVGASPGNAVYLFGSARPTNREKGLHSK